MNRKNSAEHVLAPVDFSSSSVRALRHAANLAAKSGGSLTVVYVVPADYGWLGIGREQGEKLDKSLQRHAVSRLRKLAKTNVPKRVETLFEVRIGRPAEEIVAAANESKCDLIVLSTRGENGIDRYLMGSVADRVARTASCPVLLFRPGTTHTPRKNNRWNVLRLRRNDHVNGSSTIQAG